MENITGKTLGRYQLKVLLGEGGMGMVYLAYDPNLQRDVAIKVMHPHLLRKPGFRERFLQEAVVAARLKHTGIVQVHDSGEGNGVLYIVMAFIPGGNLEEMLEDLREKGEWVVLGEAVALVEQVGLALDYAHRHGVLHRDIKPGNIMLEPEPSGSLPYRPVLTDLGLAKLLAGGVETQTGTSMGTPAYMSPEQAQGLAVDVRSDVYSLGALLYHLCVGKPPFPAKTITEAIHYHVQELPPSPSKINPNIPAELEAVILKALEKDPARRYANSAAFAEVLGKVVGSLPGPAGEERTMLTAVGGRSLVTLLEGSQVKRRGASVLDEFPQAVGQGPQDQIQVLEPGKTARTVQVKGQVISVGRVADNQIVLDDPKVSRHHVRIEQVGSTYQVTDQGSANGTFLGGVRLLMGVGQEWTPERQLQVGDTYLKLVRAREMPAAQVDAGTKPAQRKVEGRFGVMLDKTQLSVDPGSGVALSVKIHNQVSQVDHYQVGVEGVPREWVKNLPGQPLRCMPGEEQMVSLMIQPPRTSQSRAGRYPLAVVVASQEDRSQVVRSPATLTVTPYRQYTGQVYPERVRAGKAGQVRVTNRGNMPETLQVSWSDPGNELVFEPEKARIKVEEGKTAEMEFRGRLRQGRWMGGEKTHRFTTQINIPNEQQQVIPGEIISRGLIPVWLIPLVLGLCILLVSGVGAIYGLVIQPQAHATQTAIAIVDQNSDPDGDGLTNAREEKYDTNPSSPDTDGDGLKDGEEVDVYFTGPKNRDSDKDTWTDGYEVNESKTNPLNLDTDGDTLQDNVDPDPGHLPTITPLPTLTHTPTLTPILTSTPTFTPTWTPTNTLTPPPETTTLEINPNADIWFSPPRLLFLCLVGHDCPTPTPALMGYEDGLSLSWGCMGRLCGSGLIVLGFDFNQIPEGSNLKKATLFLYSTLGVHSPGQLIIQRATDPWDESGAAKPGCSEDAPIVVQSHGYDWNEMDITSLAQSLYSNNEVGYGICIRLPADNNDRSWVFTSREGPGSQKPRLRVVYEK